MMKGTKIREAIRNADKKACAGRGRLLHLSGSREFFSVITILLFDKICHIMILTKKEQFMRVRHRYCS